MASKGKLRRIEIPILSRPPPYRAGDGPELAPLTLLPVHDSDAFIVSKQVVKVDNPADPHPEGHRHDMRYLVGWPDSRLRMLLPARELFDYVSPRAFEDFEYRLSLQRDEEEEAQARADAQAAAKTKGRPKLQPATPGPAALTKSGKKIGRPSKADILARKLSASQQQSPDPRGAPPSEAAPPRATPQKKTTSRPSLSTPQKTLALAASLDDAEDEDEEDLPSTAESDADEEIQQQLQGEASGRPRTASATPKRPANGLTLRPGTSPGPRLGTSLSRDARTNTPDRKSTTPIPLPTRPVSKPQQATGKDASKSASAGAAVSKSTLQHYGFTPAGRSPILPPPPDTHAATTPATVSKSKPAPVKTPGTKRKRSEDAEASADRRKQKRKHEAAPQVPGGQEVDDGDGDGEGEVVVWEVLRLEGDRVETYEDGSQERVFKVRWKGNWPKDQNPSWEPEENITPALVRKYLKHKARAAKKGTPRASSDELAAPSAMPSAAPGPRRPAPVPRRKYSSVEEAFPGGDMDELNGDQTRHFGGVGGHEDEDEDEDDGPERLMVTAEEQKKTGRFTPHRTMSSEAISSLRRELSSSFRSGGGPSAGSYHSPVS